MFPDDGHPDIVDLALVADYLFAEGAFRAGGNVFRVGLNDLKQHIADCQKCRVNIMEIHDTILEVELKEVKPWEETRDQRLNRIGKRLRRWMKAFVQLRRPRIDQSD
jgi:hypothetical protein